MSGPKKIIEVYNTYAENYEKKFMDLSHYLKSFEEFKKLLNSGSSILDLGCGPGNSTKFFSEKGFFVKGIDFAPRMVELAKKNVPNAAFEVGDVRTFREDITYNAVLLSFCIPYLDKTEVKILIKHVHEMLSENGYLYLSYMEGDKEGFEKTSFTGNDTLYIHYFSENFLKHNLDKEGFEIIYLHKQPYHEMDGTITTDTILFARKK